MFDYLFKTIFSAFILIYSMIKFQKCIGCLNLRSIAFWGVVMWFWRKNYALKSINMVPVQCDRSLCKTTNNKIWTALLFIDLNSLAICINVNICTCRSMNHLSNKSSIWLSTFFESSIFTRITDNFLYKPSFCNRSINVTTRAITNASNKTIAKTLRQVMFFGPLLTGVKTISDWFIICNQKKKNHKGTTFKYNVYQDSLNKVLKRTNLDIFI